MGERNECNSRGCEKQVTAMARAMANNSPFKIWIIMLKFLLKTKHPRSKDLPDFQIIAIKDTFQLSKEETQWVLNIPLKHKLDTNISLSFCEENRCLSDQMLIIAKKMAPQLSKGVIVLYCMTKI